VSSRLVALTARRAALQAECALQRDDAVQAYAGIESGAASIDRVVAVLRRLTPVFVVGGVVVLVALGPARAVSLVRRGITITMYALQARSLLR
jgi:hypothetical protein